jgi:hypothetical protein
MASIQGIYLAFFGRPADPEGLAFWEEQTQGGADLSVMLDALAFTAEYQARFEGMSDAQIITSIYQSLFNRDPEPEGLAFFLEALANGTLTLTSIAVGILDGAQGDDLITVQNKEAAANLFTASLDTPEKIAAYVGEDAAQIGRDFISKVTSDPQTIPSQGETQNAVNELPGLTPDEGQVPDEGPGPGGGGVVATPLQLAQMEAAAILVTWKQLDADYGFIQNHDEGDIGNFALFNNPVPGKGYSGYDIPDKLDVPRDGWPHGETIGAAALGVNKAIVEAAIRYAKLIEAYPSVALTDEVAKDGNGRLQSVHDNLLGSISTVDGIGMPERKFPAEIQQLFDEQLAEIADGAYLLRPLYSGNLGDQGGPKHDAVRVFDYDRGIKRQDYIEINHNGTVDASGHEPGPQLHFGSGNTVDGFNIVRHEGAGIEIALKAKERLGPGEYEPTITDDGVAVYEVPGGFGTAASWGLPAKWSFDFSVITGLNGRTEELSDFVFVAKIDVDPTEGVDWLVFTFDGAWFLDLSDPFAGAFGGDDRGGDTVEQNSVNLAFSVFQNAIKEHDPAYQYEYGTFDIQFEAWHNVNLLAVNMIQVEVV